MANNKRTEEQVKMWEEFQGDLRDIRLSMRKIQANDYKDAPKELVDAVLFMSTFLTALESRIDMIEMIGLPEPIFS